MRKPVDKEIDGVVYYVTPLGALDGLKLGLKLKDVLAAGDLSNALTLLDEALVVPAMMQLAKATEYETGEVDKGGRKLRPRLSDTFDEHFVGKYSAMVEWFAFALGVNFSNFTDALPSLLARIGAVGKAKQVEKPAE